jgi:hypothetical protein
MPVCENPECGKEIPEDRAYCNEDCLRRHLELKRLARGGMNLAQEEDIWLGQRRRRRAMDVISRLAKELCPMPQGRFVSLVSYRTGLSRRKVADDYLVILLDVGILKVNEGNLHLAEE